MKVYVLIQMLGHGEVNLGDEYETKKDAEEARKKIDKETKRRYLIVSRDFWKEN